MSDDTITVTLTIPRSQWEALRALLGAIKAAVPVSLDHAAPEDLVIPRGRFSGRQMSELTDAELHLSWAGFNGSQKGRDVAAVMRKELDRRIAASHAPAESACVTLPVGPAAECPF